MAGLWAEWLTHAFWPLWTLCLAAIAFFAFDLDRFLTLEAFWFGALSLGGALIWALIWGFRGFRLPRAAEALARMDQNLKGRPLQALGDVQALGAAWAVDDVAALMANVCIFAVIAAVFLRATDTSQLQVARFAQGGVAVLAGLWYKRRRSESMARDSSSLAFAGS